MTMSKRVGYLIFALTAVAFIVFAVMMERAGAGASHVKVDVKQSSGYGFVDIEALKAYVEKNLSKVSPDSVSGRILPIEKHVSRNPYIEKTLVYRQPSGDVKVELWEEQPSFRIVTDSGNYYVSRVGNIMPVKAGIGVDVPLVYGRAEKGSFPGVKEVIRRVERDDFFSTQAIGIQVSRRFKNGKAVYDYAVDTRSGMKVMLGMAEDMDVKFENFGIIYAYLYSAGKTDDYKVVNLEFGNYLICQKK